VSAFVTKGRILRANDDQNVNAIDQVADVEAKLSAAYLVLKARQEHAVEANLDRTTELAVALAERLIGAALEIAPEKIASMAAEALSEAKGARKARIEANPIDVASLREHTVSLGDSISIEPNADLARGALVLHTDLGTIDARLTPQLERLARALKDALR
jgi:flagellar biosynthesis/type III secretory pathway protein FliH